MNWTPVPVGTIELGDYIPGCLWPNIKNVTDVGGEQSTEVNCHRCNAVIVGRCDGDSTSFILVPVWTRGESVYGESQERGSEWETVSRIIQDGDRPEYHWLDPLPDNFAPLIAEFSLVFRHSTEYLNSLAGQRFRLHPRKLRALVWSFVRYMLPKFVSP